jgi:asparaginyl-tRNA synthetase
MKDLYIAQLSKTDAYLGHEVEILGWVKARRVHSSVLFLDITDSTGTIQVVVNKSAVTPEMLLELTTVSLESGVRVVGRLQQTQDQREVVASGFEVIGRASLGLNPQPRSDFDIFESSVTAHVMANRAVYLRNPKIIATLQFRAELMRIVREWFYKLGFMEFDAPILTPAPLYDDSTAMSIDVKGQSVFLTQCAGFYLEAASHAFERVFNMGPSFRGEESRSKRHLMEYWHIKAEMAFGNREDIIGLVEDLLGWVYVQCAERCQDQMTVLGTVMHPEEFQAPFARISYEDAVNVLQEAGLEASFGVALSSADEEELSKLFDGPFWIVGIPRSVEPFPYVIDQNDPRVTMVADLIAPRGYGELCGVAEKIFDPEMLAERLAEKDKLGDPRYDFVMDIHHAGCVPHIAFGMGLERLIRWLLDIPHVRDTIPLPRPAGRRIDH